VSNFAMTEKKLNTVKDFLHWASQCFDDAALCYGHGTDNAWDEALALLAPTLKLPPDPTTDILTQRLTPDQQRTLIALVEQRIITRTPAAYLTHTAYFCHLPFYVDERVLIPRSPIAELIQQQFKPWVNPEKVSHILDLCTGSGCMAIACAYAFPHAQVDATDIDAGALAVAKKNVAQHQLGQRVSVKKGNLFEACGQQHYDIIISNPPYVSQADMAELPPEYQHEPRIGLAGGHDGLDVVAEIIQHAPAHLNDAGILVVEVGHSEPLVTERFPTLPFTWLEFKHGGHGVFLLPRTPQ